MITRIYVLIQPKTKIAINKFSEFMLSSSVYYKDMEELDNGRIEDHYSGVTLSDVSSAKGFVSTDDTTREFASSGNQLVDSYFDKIHYDKKE